MGQKKKLLILSSKVNKAKMAAHVPAVFRDAMYPLHQLYLIQYFYVNQELFIV